MIFPHKQDSELFKKILESLGKMREAWLNLYELSLEEANSIIFVQGRFYK